MKYITEEDDLLIDRTINSIVDHLGLEDSDSHLDMIIEDLVLDVKDNLIKRIVEQIKKMEEKNESVNT